MPKKAKVAAASKKIESVSDNVGELASALRDLANATAMSVIAKSGTDEDRMVAIAYLKRWFVEFRES